MRFALRGTQRHHTALCSCRCVREILAPGTPPPPPSGVTGASRQLRPDPPRGLTPPPVRHSALVNQCFVEKQCLRLTRLTRTRGKHTPTSDNVGSSPRGELDTATTHTTSGVLQVKNAQTAIWFLHTHQYVFRNEMLADRRCMGPYFSPEKYANRSIEWQILVSQAKQHQARVQEMLHGLYTPSVINFRSFHERPLCLYRFHRQASCIFG